MTFSRRVWVIAIAIIVVVAVVACVIVWRARIFQPAVPTPATVKASLLQAAKITIPPVATSTAIAVKQLPSFMRTLVLSDATGTTVRATMYAGSKLGYKITYSDPVPSGSAYIALGIALSQSKTWSVTQSIWGNTFAFIEFSGNGLNARAEFTSSAASSTSVAISAAQK